MNARLTGAWLALLTLGAGVFAAQAQGAAGDLDTGFDADGKVVTDFGAADDTDPTPDELINRLAIQPDGKIVAAGCAISSDACTTTGDFAMARFLTNGSLDTGLAGDGRATVAFGGGLDAAHDVAIQTNGMIVLAGETLGATVDFALARFKPDGSPDTDFGTGGKLSADVGGVDERAMGVAVQPDGRIVAGGDGSLVRYSSGGFPDPGFGTGGAVATSISTRDVALQPDGKIVVAGGDTASDDFALARYNANGTPDTGFGVGGKVITEFPPGPFAVGSLTGVAHRVIVQPDGKIAAAGVVKATMLGSTSIGLAVARYNPNGSLDTSFGTSGRTTAGTRQFDPADNGLAMQVDGKLALASTVLNGPSDARHGDFFLVRAPVVGLGLDGSFSGDGQLTTNFANSDAGASYDIANDLAAATGTLVAAGGSAAAPGTTHFDFALARYLAPAKPPAGSPPATGTSPSPPTPDATEPILSALGLSPARFRAASFGPTISAKVGTKVSYRLSEAARVKFRVERGLRGRRVSGRCVKPRRSNRGKRRCTRYRLLRGSFGHQGRAGQNSLRFRGRLRGRKLKPGRYRLHAVAIDAAGNRSSRERVRFRIVRR